MEFIPVCGVSVDTVGNIYVVDSGNARVMKWAPGALAGTVVAGGNGVGNANNTLDTPDGLFVDPITLAIWIADTYNNRIVKWSSPLGNVVIYGSGPGSGAHQFWHPRGVFVDTAASNTLYVADTENHRIQKWLPDASSGVTVAGQTGALPPNTVCARAMWAANATTVAGSSLGANGISPHLLTSPWDAVLDNTGAVYVSDTGNLVPRVQMWLLGATSGTTVAGGTSGLGLDQFDVIVHGLSLDANGNLYAADQSRVMKWALGAQIGSVVAGGNGVGSDTNQLNYAG
ncbi:unnamed protein product, partial [Rotaria sp. Silwood1]